MTVIQESPLVSIKSYCFNNSHTEYTLLKSTKVKYGSSNIIHSERCFKERFLISGKTLSGTMIWRPSVRKAAIFPRKEEKSNFFIPTDSLFILHISGITLFFPTKNFIKNYNPIALLGTDSFVPVA